MTIKEIRQQTPPVYRGTPPKMTVQHTCHTCGKIRRADIAAGYEDRITSCQSCGAQYVITRAHHITGLINRRPGCSQRA